MGTRSEVKKFIKSGRVFVNGAPASGPEQKVTEEDDVELDGEKVSYERYVYYMLNKPQGVVSATKDNTCRTVLSLITDGTKKDLFPVGRLDKDTEGFVFITDDGALAHKMLSPRSHVEKEYEVTLERPAEESYKELFASGMTIDGGENCMPAQLFFTDDDHVVRLILHEGKFHQVKRMMEAAGNKVTFLRRTRIGGIELDPTLPLGGCREILHKETLKLYAK